jgi:hypothetical protein
MSGGETQQISKMKNISKRKVTLAAVLVFGVGQLLYRALHLHGHTLGKSDPLAKPNTNMLAAGSTADESMKTASNTTAVLNTALSIERPDEFLLYEWPGISVLSSFDFTIDLWYLTPRQSEVSNKVAILSNMRQTGDGSQYGRSFSLHLTPDGVVEAAFEGYKASTRGLQSGTVRSLKRVDDGQWHHIRVFRSHSALRLTLEVDGAVSFCTFPSGIDVDSQEQRVIIGGGNDRSFRKCSIDELRIYRRIVGDDEIGVERGLVAYFPFETITNGAVLLDCSPNHGDAIRVGKRLRTEAAFVPSPLRTMPRCEGASSRGQSHAPNGTLLLTYLGIPCDGRGAQQQVGHLYQMEAYLGALWLDVHRVGVDLRIITECVPSHISETFSSPRVSFQAAESIIDTASSCTKKVPLMLRRFLVYNALLPRLQGYSHIATLDLRDSRLNHAPQWPSDAELWLQTIRFQKTDVCGGFQAGTHAAMMRMMSAMAELAEKTDCGQNDQTMLNKLYAGNQLGTDKTHIQLDGDLINSQHTRVFEHSTAFEHGNWWMSKKRLQDPFTSKAYLRDVPFLGSMPATPKRKSPARSQLLFQILTRPSHPRWITHVCRTTMWLCW